MAEDEPILFSAGIEDDGSLDAESQRIANFTVQMQDFADAQAQVAERVAQAGIQADQARVESTRSLQDVIAEAMAEQSAALQSNVQAQEDWNVVVQSSGDSMAAWKQQMQDLGLEPLSIAIKDNAEAIDAEAQSVNGLSAALGDAQGRLEAFKAAQQEVTQAVVSEQPSVEQMTGDEGDDGGGGFTGGFGAARAVRGAANLARIGGAGTGASNVLMGGADILLISQGFDQLKGVFAGLNETIEASGMSVPLLTEGLTALGVPMAGLVAVLGTLALGVGVVIAGFEEIKNALKDTDEALQVGVEQFTKYQSIVHSGATETDIETGLAKAQDASGAIVNIADDTFKKLQDQYGDAGARALEAFGGVFLPEVKKLNDEGAKAGESARKAAGDIGAFNTSLSDLTVVANTAADAARKAAADHASQQQKFEADDKATFTADQEKVVALNESIKAQRESIAIIEQSNQNEKLSAEQRQKNTEAIAAYNKQIADEQDQIKHLTEVSEVGAQKREAQALQDKAQTDLADRMIALRKQETTDLQGTSDSIEKRLDSLKSEREGVQQAIKMEENSGNTSESVKQKVNALNDQLGTLDTRIQSITIGLPEVIKGEQDAADAKNAQKAANKEYAEQVKETEKALKDIVTAEDNYDKAIQKSRETLTNTLQDLADKERAAEEQYKSGSTQDTYARETIALKEQRDVAKVEEETANKITDIHTKLGETETKIEEETSNKIADIRTKLGEEETKTVTDYNRQIVDDQVKYQQDFQKLQTEANNTLARDALTHAEKLADIQRSSDANIEKDAADRNFQKLATDLQAKSTQVNKENEAYADQQAQLQLHLSQQEAALGVSLANEEAKQQTAEQRKLADEQTTADNEIKRQETDEARKLAAAEVAADNAVKQAETAEQRKTDAYRTSEQQQLDDLTRSNNEHLTLLRQRYYQEYEMDVVRENQQEQLAAQTEQQVINTSEAILNNGIQSMLSAGASSVSNVINNLRAQTATAAPAPTPNYAATAGQIAAASSAPTNTSSGGGFDLFGAISGIGSIFGFAEGGNFQAGQPFVMGEAGPETLSIGANTMGVNASALVYPLQSGNVDNGGSSKPPDIQALVQAITGALNRSSIDTAPISRAIADGITEMYRP